MPILTLLSRRASVAVLTAAILLASSSPTLSFLHQHTHHHQSFITRPSTTTPLLQMAKSYGPQDAEIISSSNDNTNNIKAEFTSLLNAVVTSDKPEELPSLLATNIEMILSAMNTNGLIEQVIQEDIQTQSNNVERLDELSSAVNVIVSFVETFVEEAQSMDEVYKQLMGKIFQSISPNNQEGGDTAAAPFGEVALEELLANEKEAFTPGFLRHVDGECNRIASLKTISPESAKMLEILRVIQARILEELGKGIGEGAIVLGQLLGYDEKAERLAVLDAGLAVRGVDFAHELKGLTSEALEGFQSVQGDVDPGLVKSVEEIDERIQQFIEKSSQHFQ
ncbi:hypothetical protein QTG54_009212 [Skeletonema marinoi]|uniref:Uncharacterized protein n=1 Tax=Skeletonema marinoi TaxID=267567 RepID=A0AAD9DAK7_9STRA|nr:hypothetical protein QTG54_009212 [Skeletonema marinoi]